MDSDSTPRLPPPRILEHRALTLVGISQHYKAGENAAIPSQWRRFSPHMGHIDNEVRGVSYGVVYNIDDANTFDYLCGVEVAASGHLPDDCIELNVPARTYAVFEHAGHISTIQATFRAIWEHGLADAGARAADGPVLERYDERYDPRTGLGGFEILVPVVSAATQAPRPVPR